MELRHQLRTIDLAALRRNIQLIRSAVPAGSRLLAVVKADAYGHGAVPVAKEALTAGADWLAVALVEEGLQLREAGIRAPILVLGAVGEQAAVSAARQGITVPLCSADAVPMLQRAAETAGRPLQLHLKLDTGMGRIGIRGEAEIRAALDALAQAPMLRLSGVFTHFADADGQDDVFTQEQLERFRRWTALLPAGLLRHCANSAAIHRLMPQAAYDMVRMGISMYGYPPVESELPLQPMLRWESEVSFVKQLPAGASVSYGCTWHAQRDSRIATIACGYGDGYHRAAGGRAQVLIHGRRVPVVGRICMDQMMADVTDLGTAVRPGDRVTLLGRDGEACISAEEIAGWAGTISYEVLLAATARVPRRWINGSEDNG